MNSPNFDELLSACHDGETTPEERARVDALLANDPEARRALDECRKLSGLLRETPSQKTPPEFNAAVMQNIERQMLLGPAEGSSTRPASTGAPVSPRRLRFSPAAVGMAAAAVLLVAVVVARRPGEEVAMHGANSESIDGARADF